MSEVDCQSTSRYTGVRKAVLRLRMSYGMQGGSVQSNVVQQKVDSPANQTAEAEPSALVTTLKALLPLFIILIAGYFALGKQ